MTAMKPSTVTFKDPEARAKFFVSWLMSHAVQDTRHAKVRAMGAVYLCYLVGAAGALSGTFEWRNGHFQAKKEHLRTV